MCCLTPYKHTFETLHVRVSGPFFWTATYGPVVDCLTVGVLAARIIWNNARILAVVFDAGAVVFALVVIATLANLDCNDCLRDKTLLDLDYFGQCYYEPGLHLE
jgi:hypothetical protein